MALHADTDSPAPARRSKLVWAAISFAVVGVLVLLGATFNGWFNVQAKLDALKAQGLPTSAVDLNDFYKVPEGVADRTREWVAAIDGVKRANLAVGGASLPFIGNSAVPTPIPPPGQPWADLEAARTLLVSKDKEIQAIRLAASVQGQVRFPVDLSVGINAMLIYTQDARSVSRLLQLDAHVSAHDGDHARALADLKAIFALSDAMRGEPLLISQLIRIAIHVTGDFEVESLLPYCQWSDSDLESLQQAIQSAEFKEEMANGLAGDRAVALTELNRMPLGPFRRSNQGHLLELMEDSIAGYSKPWPEVLSHQREVSARMDSLKKNGLLGLKNYGVITLAPSLTQASLACARATARQRCACAGIAAQRFRLKHGRLPNSLGEIDKNLLGDSTAAAENLLDPFDGQPLRLKFDEQQMLIYSISDNLVDDGGATDQNNSHSTVDLVFKVSK